jgi:hypothetical protein
MSRHNRRRTRGGHKQSAGFPIYQNLYNPSELGFPDEKPPQSGRSVTNYRNGVTARHWHNRYMAWQARERRQREEQASLEAEKRRIFGGSDDEDSTSFEDDGLCEKMLEYFGRLDFIEP